MLIISPYIYKQCIYQSLHRQSYTNILIIHIYIQSYNNYWYDKNLTYTYTHILVHKHMRLTYFYSTMAHILGFRSFCLNPILAYF